MIGVLVLAGMILPSSTQDAKSYMEFWAPLSEVRYEQLENLKIFRWGMHGAEQEIAPATET